MPSSSTPSIGFSSIRVGQGMMRPAAYLPFPMRTRSPAGNAAAHAWCQACVAHRASN